MNFLMANGLLIAGTVNLTLANDDEDFPGCCTVRCGPCCALKWLRDNEADWVNHCLIALGVAGGYNWQNEDKTMNWSVIEAHWNKHKGCSKTDGVYKPCVDRG